MAFVFVKGKKLVFCSSPSDHYLSNPQQRYNAFHQAYLALLGLGRRGRADIAVVIFIVVVVVGVGAIGVVSIAGAVARRRWRCRADVGLTVAFSVVLRWGCRTHVIVVVATAWHFSWMRGKGKKTKEKRLKH